MRPERLHRLLSTALLAILVGAAVSGCIFWPPYGFPGGEDTIVVENRSDAELVLRVAGADLIPMTFAVPPSTTGEMVVFLVEPPITVDLLDPECNEISTITLDEEAGYLLIDEDGTRVTAPDAGGPDSERQLAEYFECEAFGMDPELDDPGIGGLGGRLVVSGGPTADLYAVDLPGRSLEQLTDGSAWDGPGSVAPDGTVAFVRADVDDFSGSIWTIDPDGGEARQIREQAHTPIWSPDGTRVGFIDGDPFGGGLVVLDIESGEETVVASDTVLGFAWSPEGDQLAYVVPLGGRDPMAPTFESQVLLATPGERGVTLARLGASGPLAWSPDGSKLAVEVFEGFETTLSVIDATTGSELFGVDAGSSFVTGGAWSPSGDRLAYVRTDPVSLEQPAALMVVSDGGGDPLELADLDDLSISTPIVWSPTGNQVAVAGLSMTGGASLWIVDAETGDAGRLMTGADGLLGWR